MTERSVDKKTKVRSTEEALKLIDLLVKQDILTKHETNLLREALMSVPDGAQSRSDEEQPAPSGGQQDDLILALYSKIDFLRGKIELLESGLVQSKRTWRGLTKEEIEDAWPFSWRKHESVSHFAIYHAIEAKLKAKNSL